MDRRNINRHWANWQAGGQASRQIVKHAAGWRFKRGNATDDGPLSPSLRTGFNSGMRPVTYAGM